jgi:hypothetical protein
MNDVFATLLVDTVNTRPTLIQLDVKRLLQLDLESYEWAIETIIVKLYVENNHPNFLLQYSGLTPEELEVFMRFIRDSILFTYVRDEVTSGNLRNLISRFLFPEDRADILLRYLRDNRLTIINNYLFRNTQDSYALMQRIEANQRETLNQRKE